MISAYCALAGRCDMRLFEVACREWLGDAFETFRAAGLLRPISPSDTVLCQACFEQHWLSVEWDDEAQCSVARCPVGGTVRIFDDDIRRVEVDLARCLELLQAAIVEKQRRPRELVTGKAWYLGNAQTNKIDWNTVFVPVALTGQELALLAEATATLPRCMLDVVLTGGQESWPDLRLARTLHALPLCDIADWSGCNIEVRDTQLQRWLQSFLAGRAAPPARGGRPPSKSDWLRANWRGLEPNLRAMPTDTARADLLSAAYAKDTGGGTISRNTVVQLLDQIMSDRVKNCQ